MRFFFLFYFCFVFSPSIYIISSSVCRSAAAAAAVAVVAYLERQFERVPVMNVLYALFEFKLHIVHKMGIIHILNNLVGFMNAMCIKERERVSRRGRKIAVELVACWLLG